MAVVIEATTIVVLLSALERRFPGGVAAFAQQAPNMTFHSDGQLAAVSVMAPGDTRLVVGQLTKHGFADPLKTPSNEICIVDQSKGFLTPCDWLSLDLRAFSTAEGEQFGATIAWVGDEPGAFAAPRGWTPRRIEQISTEDLARHYEIVKVHRNETGGAVTAYRHRETGRLMYIGRPAPATDDVQERSAALARELSAVLAMPPSAKRHAAAADLCRRATELADATGREEANPLLVEGVVARSIGRWTVAESAFRRITERWPDLIDGWLEWTWALSSLERLEEAEAAARRAVDLKEDSAAARGNLATVLLQRGKPEDALAAAERAIELDPSEANLRKILEQVRRALDERGPERSSNIPWYRRWLR